MTSASAVALPALGHSVVSTAEPWLKSTRGAVVRAAGTKSGAVRVAEIAARSSGAATATVAVARTVFFPAARLIELKPAPHACQPSHRLQRLQFWTGPQESQVD